MEIKNIVSDSGKHRCYKLLHIITKCSTRKLLHMHKIKMLPGKRSDQTGFQYCCTPNIKTSNGTFINGTSSNKHSHVGANFLHFMMDYIIHCVLRMKLHGDTIHLMA